jgi:hypothetical protein
MIPPQPFEEPVTDGLIGLPDEVAQDSVSEISLGGSTSVVPSEGIVDQRSDRAHKAFGDKSPGLATIKNDITNGNELAVRERLAKQKDLEFHERKVEVIRKMAEDRAREGKPVSQQDVDFIMGMSEADFNHDPNTILESDYAKSFFQKVVDSNQGQNLVKENLQTTPETAVDLDIASNIKTKQEIVRTEYQNLEAEYQKMGFLDTAVSYGSQFLISPLESYRLHDVVTDTVSFLPGENLSEQIDHLWSLPADQFKTALSAAAKELAGKNVLTAMKFVESVLSYSSSDIFMDNVFGIVGISDLPLLTSGRLLGAAGKAVRGRKSVTETVDMGSGKTTVTGSPEVVEATRKALKDAVKADSGIVPKPPEEVAEAVGDVPKAAVITALKDARARFFGKDPLAESGRLAQSIPSIFNINRVIQGTTNLAAPAVERLSNTLQRNAAGLMDSVSDTSLINRLTDEAAEAGFKNTKAELDTLYPHLNDAILDTRYVRAEETSGHVNEVELQVGKKGVSKPSATPSAERRKNVQGLLSTAEHQKARFEKTVADPIDVKRMGKDVIDHYKKQIVELDAAITRYKAELTPGYKVVDKGGYSTLEKTEVEVAIGKSDATLFEKADEAYTWASRVYNLKTEEYRILQKGTGYYISVRKHVDETQGNVRDQLSVGTGHQTPRSVMNTFIGLLRSPEDLLSAANRQSRNVATHGTQELHRYALQVANEVGAVSNKSKKKLQTILQEGRDQEYVENGITRRGVFHRDLGELERAWTARFGRGPTEKEAAAYMSAVQLNDWDWMFRNLGLYRDKARLGIERHQFSMMQFDEGTKTSSMVDVPHIEGKLVKDLDWSNPEFAGVWLYDKTSQEGRWFNKNDMTAEEVARVANKIKVDGYRAIQVANPLDKPLRKFANTDNEINFIVVPETTRAPLDWQQLPYRPGGHVEYLHDNWVKQMKVRRSEDGRQVYEGDVSIFNQATEAEAVFFAKAMDTARLLLKDNKIDELKAFLPKNLPFTFTKFDQFFKETVDNAGNKVEARLSLDEEIRHTVSGRNLADAHPDMLSGYSNFHNSIRSSYNLYGQIDKKYASMRDPTLDSVKRRQGDDTHLFKVEPAALMDPLGAINKGMANVMRSRYLNDYKIQSAEKYIEEFASVLKVPGGKDELRRDPIEYLHNARIDDLHPDKGLVAAAKNSRRAVLELLGTESELSQGLRWMQEKMLNGIFGKLGQPYSDWVAAHMLPVQKDPLKYARAVGFHSKLGLFNPVQLFLQAQTLTHVAAVSGVDNGLRGLSAATLMRRLALTRDEGVINHFADMATKLGWKKADFLESYAEFRKTGLYNVEGEVAVRDDYFDPKLFNGVAGKFLDKGTFFFREGERLTRMTAWNAAYREWKKANPGKAIDSQARNEILSRQNLLSVNMTRSSASWWQQGVLSVPTQFFSYQVRLMEQFFSKRLTTSEKAHAFLTYSAMYGVPTATGAVAGIWPWYEDIRQAAIERDIDVNSPGMKAVMEGIPSLVWSTLTGNDQNWSQRYGPNGLSFFKDISKGKTEQVFGASANIIGDMLKSADPIARGIVSVFKPDGEQFEFIAEDFINAVSNVSTINNVGKMIFALNTHRYMSKNETYLGPATTMDAILTGITGTMPLEMSDAFLKSHSLQEQQKMQAEVEKGAIKYFRRGIKAGYEGDETAMAANMRNARLLMIGGGFRHDQQVKAMEKAISGHESLIDKINRDWWQKAKAEDFPNRLNKMFNLKPEEKN